MLRLLQRRHLLFEYGVAAFCFTLPLSPRLASWLAAIAFLLWLFNRKQPFRLSPLLLLPALFLYFAAGAAYSQNQAQGWQSVETKLPLLLFPLLFMGAPPSSLQTRKWLQAFILGCLIAVITSLGSASFTFFHTGENFFFYNKLGSFLHFHPSYFAMYLSMALFSCIILWNHAWRWALAAVFLLFFFLLSARMQLLILAAMALAALLARAPRKGPAILTGAGAVVLFLSILTLLPSTRQRFEKLIHPSPGQPSNVRLQTWDAALELIRLKPLTGTGTGDYNAEVNEIYRERNYAEPLEDKLNAHNQYLQTAATLGIPAALLWLASLLWPLILAWKRKKPLFLWFLILFLLSNLTESMLGTQRGTLFFGFFHSLFLAEMLYSSEKTD